MASSAPARSYTIYPFEERDLARGLALTQGDGWSHRSADWTFLYSTGAGLVARRTLDDEVVGTILYWTYGTDQASIGMLIVDPMAQRQGIGKALMDECFRVLEGRTIHLIATTSGVPLYERLGFRQTGKVTIFKGVVSRGAAALQDEVVEGLGMGLRLATSADRPRIKDILNAGAGQDRTTLLDTVLDLPSAEAVLLEREGRVVGVSIYRQWLDGYWIGPVVAPTVDSARLLVLFWLRRYPDRLTRVDVTDHFDAGWLEDWGLKKFNLECPTMIRGTPSSSIDRRGLTQYAILGQATG